MLNLEPRNEGRVQLPTENEKVLFLNEDGELVLKDDAGVIEKVTTNYSPKIYRAILTQTGTNTPVATVLENNLGGNITYAYTSVGTYTATATGLLNPTTGIEISGGHTPAVSSDVPIFGIKSQGNNSFIITSGDALNQGLVDGILNKTLITIYKY